MRAMVLAIAAISLDLLIGQGGLVSFGHSAFVAIGAYSYGILIHEGVYSIFAILGTAAAAAGLFALVTGAISLRTSGVYFIMITLAFGQMLFFALGSLSRYGADDGLTLWTSADALGTGLFKADLGLFFTILAALVGAWWLVDRIAGSRFGRVLRAARQNPTRVATMGYSVTGYRLTAYVIAGLIAALAGVLWAAQANFVSPAMGAWQRSGDLIAIVVLGGMGTRNGALIGALVFVLLEEGLSQVTHDWRLIFGPLLVLVALYAHGGLAGWLDRLRPERRP
jgi:branched-chain amino acid transport system permease protein